MEILIIGLIILFIVYFTIAYFKFRKFFDGEIVSIKRKGKVSKKQRYYKAYYDAVDESEFFENKALKLVIVGGDKIELTSYLLRNKNSHLYIIMIHDFDGSFMELRQNALDYWRKGYNCLCVELKGCGMSEGVVKSLGFLDRLDILKWIDKIKSIDIDAEFVLYGRGMGGACALYTICEDNKNIKGVIVDGAYGNLKKELQYLLGAGKIFYPVINLLANLIADFRIKDADVSEYLPNIATPILFIQGSKDKTVPMRMFEELYQLKRENKYQAIFEVDHNEAMIKDKERYLEVIDSFLNSL